MGETAEEAERSIAAHLGVFLRKRGYEATVTVKHEGGAHFFASSPAKVPLEVWQEAIEDLHYGSSYIPLTWAVSAPPQGGTGDG